MMDIVEVKTTGVECNIGHFAAMADILIRRPHLVKTRKKLVAGVKIIHQEVLTDVVDEKLLENVKKDFLAGALTLTENDYSQQEFDYSESMKIIRKVIYKNVDIQESSECIIWNVVDGSRAILYVVPLDRDKDDDFRLTKLSFCVAFDSVLHQVSL